MTAVAIPSPAPAPVLVDSYGAPMRRQVQIDPWAPPSDPLSRISESEAVIAFRQSPTSTIATWTISAIRSALAAHADGDFTQSGMLADSVIADDRVQATLGSRAAALFGNPIVHTPGTNDRDGSVSLAWTSAYARCCDRATMSEVLRIGVMMSVCIAQIQWDTTGPQWVPYLRIVHPSQIRWRWDLRRFVVNTQDGEAVVTPGDGHWFVFAPHGLVRGWMQGVVRSISQPWFIRTQAWRDWARFNERHGLPMILARVPASGDVMQKRQFIDGLPNLGQEAVVSLPQGVDGHGYDLDMLEARDRAWETFQGTIAAADMAIVLAIKWQNLTTQVEGGSSYAAARVHGGVEQSAAAFDNGTIADAVESCLSRPFALFNFGDPLKATRTSHDIDPVEDDKSRAMVLQAAATALRDMAQAGKVPADVVAFLRQFGIQIPGGVIDVKPISVGLGGAK